MKFLFPIRTYLSISFQARVFVSKKRLKIADPTLHFVSVRRKLGSGDLNTPKY